VGWKIDEDMIKEVDPNFKLGDFKADLMS
jgi:hypothetical protein